MKIYWTTFARLITILLIALVPTCLLADLYMWTDEGGNPVVSSEKPPAHITEFQTVGQSPTDQEADQTSSPDSQEEIDSPTQYEDFPTPILNKIKRTARERWPDSEQAQEAMVHRQVRACRYVLNARNLNIPVSVFDKIMEDVGLKWPNDYEQQAAYIAKQYSSYQAILSYENLDLSDAEINSIKEKVAERWLFDYVKQEQFLRREAKYYVERKSN